MVLTAAQNNKKEAEIFMIGLTKAQNKAIKTLGESKYFRSSLDVVTEKNDYLQNVYFTFINTLAFFYNLSTFLIGSKYS